MPAIVVPSPFSNVTETGGYKFGQGFGQGFGNTFANTMQAQREQKILDKIMGDALYDPNTSTLDMIKIITQLSAAPVSQQTKQTAISGMEHALNRAEQTEPVAYWTKEGTMKKVYVPAAQANQFAQSVIDAGGSLEKPNTVKLYDKNTGRPMTQIPETRVQDELVAHPNWTDQPVTPSRVMITNGTVTMPFDAWPNHPIPKGFKIDTDYTRGLELLETEKRREKTEATKGGSKTIYNIEDPTQTREVFIPAGAEYTPPQGWSINRPVKNDDAIFGGQKAKDKGPTLDTYLTTYGAKATQDQLYKAMKKWGASDQEIGAAWKRYKGAGK